MDQIMPRERARSLLSAVGPTGKRVLCRATIATLAVTPHRQSWRDWFENRQPGEFDFVVGTVNDPTPPLPRGSFPVAKVAYYSHTVGEIETEYMFIRQAPGATQVMNSGVRDFVHALMEGVAGDVYFTHAVDEACSAVLFYMRPKNVGEDWRCFPLARMSVQDFHVGPLGEVAVVSNGRAAFVDADRLFHRIALDRPALDQGEGVKVGKGALLVRIFANEGENMCLAVFSPEKQETVVYDQFLVLKSKAHTPH